MALSLAIKAGEALKHFQWLTHEQADPGAPGLADPAAKEQVSDELADVLSPGLSIVNCQA